MVINIDVYKTGDIISSDNCLGRQGEKNSTKLVFNFEDEIYFQNIKLVFSNKKGVFIYDLIGKEFLIPFEITTETQLDLQLKIERDNFIGKSKTLKFKFDRSLNMSSGNVFESIKSQAIEDFSYEIEKLIDESGVIEYDNSFQN